MKNIKKTNLSYIIKVPVIHDESKLLFAEAKRHIPFAVKRFYLISKVDKGAIRGLHAHRKLRQVLFCIQGSVTFVLDNGSEREKILLNKSNEGIFIDKWMWREMREFSADAVLLVLASDYYLESDYIRDYNQFLQELTLRKRGLMYRYQIVLQQVIRSFFTNPISSITEATKKQIKI